jgi:hypothetical protein
MFSRIIFRNSIGSLSILIENDETIFVMVDSDPEEAPLFEEKVL